MDCSGLVQFLLNKVNPEICEEIVYFTKEIRKVPVEKFARLFTHDFYGLFEQVREQKFNSKFFETVKVPEDIRQGDILVYLPPARRAYGHIGVIASNEVLHLSEDIIKVDFLHSSRLGKGVHISPLFITHHSGEITGVSLKEPSKMKHKMTLLGRLKE